MYKQCGAGDNSRPRHISSELLHCCCWLQHCCDLLMFLQPPVEHLPVCCCDHLRWLAPCYAVMLLCSTHTHAHAHSHTDKHMRTHSRARTQAHALTHTHTHMHMHTLTHLYATYPVQQQPLVMGQTPPPLLSLCRDVRYGGAQCWGAGGGGLQHQRPWGGRPVAVGDRAAGEWWWCVGCRVCV
jgi:hypothetical protein